MLCRAGTIHQWPSEKRAHVRGCKRCVACLGTWDDVCCMVCLPGGGTSLYRPSVWTTPLSRQNPFRPGWFWASFALLGLCGITQPFPQNPFPKPERQSKPSITLARMFEALEVWLLGTLLNIWFREVLKTGESFPLTCLISVR